MRILFIFYKEIIQGLRDIKTLLIMIFMPTILIVLLSIVFRNDFTSNIDLKEIKVTFIGNWSGTGEVKYKSISEILNIMNIKYDSEEVLTDYDKSKEILIKQSENGDIELYYDKKIKDQGEIITSILKNNIHSVPLKTVDTEDIKNSSNFVTERNLINKFSTSSLNYYGITMITLTIMFSSVTGAYKIIKERNEGTFHKLLTLPVTLKEVLFGKLLGSLAISSMQIAILIIISSQLLKVNLGDNKAIIFLLLLTEATFAITLGMLFGNFFKDNKGCWLTLLSLIMGWGFLGGAFIPPEFISGSSFKALTIVSPLKYVNTSIFNVIYINNYEIILPVISILIITAIVLILIASYVMEAYI